MPRLITPFENIVSLQDIDTLEWEQVTTESSFFLEIVVERTVVLSSTVYFPPNERRVRLHQLSSVLFPYVENDLGLDDGFDAWMPVEVRTDGIVSRALVVPTTVRLSEDVVTFTARNFLSLLSGHKRTPEGETERISVYCHEDETHDFVVSTLWEHSGRYITDSVTIFPNKFIEGRTFWYFDLDPRTFSAPHPLARLVQYEVRYGNRSQVFCVVPRLDGEATTFAFINSFGQVDKFHAFGLSTEEHKYSRSVALFDDGLRTYKVEASPELEVNTGLLEEGSKSLLEDLLRSGYVYVDGAAVVITEASHKPTSSIYAREDATISYQFANGSRVRVNEPARTFDNTFDTSFE